LNILQTSSCITSKLETMIEGRIKLDQEGINEYDENMNEYLRETYKHDLNVYVQQKPQNDKVIEQYENKLKK
jgi:hypothetical protein